DPVNSSLSLGLRSNLRTFDSFVKATGSVKDWKHAPDFALGTLETLELRPTNLVQQGLNETISNTDRASTLGVEMRGILSQAMDIANSSHNNQFIFAGYQVNTKPFQLDIDTVKGTYTDYFGNAAADYQKITYNGDAGVMQRTLAPDQSIILNVNGKPALNEILDKLLTAYEALVKSPYDANVLQASLAGLQTAADVLDQNRTSNGTRLRQAETAADYLEQVKIETKGLLSKKEDTNMAEAYASLAGQKTTYQAVLEVSQRAISALSLFDYMQ
ncbi:MAG: hypothetical protein WCK35_28170, partial [Chloroflexota bacterium]